MYSIGPINYGPRKIVITGNNWCFIRVKASKDGIVVSCALLLWSTSLLVCSLGEAQPECKGGGEA